MILIEIIFLISNCINNTGAVKMIADTIYLVVKGDNDINLFILLFGIFIIIVDFIYSKDKKIN